jgi:hypothetical protein
MEHDLKLNDPRIVEEYEAYIIQQLLNHNVAAHIYLFYVIESASWHLQNEITFNQIDHDVERSM